MQYMFFFVWLLSRRIITLRFIHVVGTNSSFFFIAKYRSVVWRTKLRFCWRGFTLLSVYGFYKRKRESVPAQVFVWIYVLISLEYVEVGCLGHARGEWMKRENSSPKSSFFMSLLRTYGGPPPPHPRQRLAGLLFQSLRQVHSAIALQFSGALPSRLMMLTSLCVLARCLYTFFGEIPAQILYPFLNWLFVFLLLPFKSSI